MIAKGNVESWLGELLNEQQKSLHGVIRDAFRAINTDGFELLSFINNFPAQVIKYLVLNKENCVFQTGFTCP